MLLYKDIIKEDNNNLRKNSIDVEIPLNEETIKTLEEMNQYLINGYNEEFELYDQIRPGVGISAVQIDVLKRMFIIMTLDEFDNYHHYVVINPKIISHSEQLTYLPSGEGCLSVDRETEGLVLRPKKITAECYLYDFENKELTKTTLKLKGYLAIVFQHEYDHLNGVLFVDRINKDNPFLVPENATPINFDIEEK